MSGRQEWRGRLKNIRNKTRKNGASAYVEKYEKNEGPIVVRNGDGMTRYLNSLTTDYDDSMRIVLAEVEKNNALRVCVQSDESHVVYSKVYLAPLPELGGKEYFLNFGEFTYKDKPVMAFAADFFGLLGFETYKKYYLLSPDDESFTREEQLIFDGLAELVTMDGYTVPANPLGGDLWDVKRGFEAVNKDYEKKGLPVRRNLILLPMEE